MIIIFYSFLLGQAALKKCLQDNPNILCDALGDKIKILHTKLFNERKTFRLSYQKKVDKLM